MFSLSRINYFFVCFCYLAATVFMLPFWMTVVFMDYPFKILN